MFADEEGDLVKAVGAGLALVLGADVGSGVGLVVGARVVELVLGADVGSGFGAL
jgi:hypothetical protein